MKKCKNCHTELRDETEVCPECGEEVKSSKDPKQEWIIVIAITVVVLLLGGGLWWFMKNEEKPKTPATNEPKQEQKKDVIKKDKNVVPPKTIEAQFAENPAFLAASVSWYGTIVEGEAKWSNWHQKDLKVREIPLDEKAKKAAKADFYCTYELPKKQGQGYVLTDGGKEVNLYSEYPKDAKVTPMATISLDKLAEKMSEDKVVTAVTEYSNQLEFIEAKKKEKPKKKAKKKEKAEPKETEQQKLLNEVMEKWQKTVDQTYEPATLDPKAESIQFKDQKIVNKIEDKNDCLLSMEGKFADVSMQETSSGYQVIGAYYGTSENAKGYRYLFVLHDGKPEVYVAHLPEAVGDTARGDAMNFVPTQDKALIDAFTDLMDEEKAKTKEKSVDTKDTTEVEEEVEVKETIDEDGSSIDESVIIETTYAN